MSKLGVAVIGVGVLGKRHAENLRRAIPEAQLVAVADSDLKRASQVAAELEVEHYSENPEVILARKDVQAVVIASPSKFHAGLIKLAAEAGKHVFCEKPIALTPKEAEAALTAIDKAGVQLQIGFMRRYDPAYADAKQRIEAGEIGDPIMFKSLGRDRQPPPASFFQGGINGTLFSDAAIHDFDLARWLMNDEMEEVHSYAGLLACPELAQFDAIDVCLINLKFARGGIGNIEAYRKSSYGYDIRTEIVGSQGTIQVGYLPSKSQLVLTGAGAVYEMVDHWLVRFADAYLTELRDFVQVIRSGGSTRVTGQDGLRALEAAVAAEQSYRESRPVALSTQTRAPDQGPARAGR